MRISMFDDFCDALRAVCHRAIVEAAVTEDSELDGLVDEGMTVCGVDGGLNIYNGESLVVIRLERLV